MQNKIEYDIYSKIIKDDIFYKHKWFVDFRIFKNVILGYLLINNIFGSDLDKFNKRLNSEKYKNRITDLPSYNFDNIKDISLEDIYNYDYNKYYYIVPNTTFMINFIELINKINQNAEIVDKPKTIITINLFPFKFNKVIRFHIEEYISSVLNNIIVKTVYIEPENITKTINNYDAFILYDVEELLVKKPFETVKDKQTALNLSKKFFISQKITNKENILKMKTIEEIHKDFKFIENYLNVIFEFKYIDPLQMYI